MIRANSERAAPISCDGGDSSGGRTPDEAPVAPIMQPEDYIIRLPFQGSCKECELNFDTPATLLAHFPCFLRTEFSEKSAGGSATFRCPLKADGQPCPRTFANIDALRNHMRFKLEKLFQCSECERRFVTRQNTESHVERHHMGHSQHQCSDCSAAYSDIRGLQAHREKTGHGTECVVESVEFFEDEASREQHESADSQEEEVSGDDDSDDPNDDPENDPDFIADDRPAAQRTRSSFNALAITNHPPATSDRSPNITMRFPVKRGRGRPRKHPYPNSDDRRQLTCRQVVSVPITVPDEGVLPIIRRGPGRPRKNQNPYISAPVRPVYSRRELCVPSTSNQPATGMIKTAAGLVYKVPLTALKEKTVGQQIIIKTGSQASAMTTTTATIMSMHTNPSTPATTTSTTQALVTPQATITPVAQAPHNVITRSSTLAAGPIPVAEIPEPTLSDRETESAASTTQSDITVLSSIKHCATCNAMFFQQADFDRHFDAHRVAGVEKVSVQCQTWQDAADDRQTRNNIPGSNSEQQDSSDSFVDAVAIIPFREMDQSDYPDEVD